MVLKDYLKGNKFLYRLLASYRGYTLCRQINREQKEYANRALKLNLSLTPDEEQAAQELKKRLLARGLYLQRKRKGDLHIVYATRPSIWEPHNIPPQLAKFGRVTTYYYAERGFNDLSQNWPTVRKELDNDLLEFVSGLHKRQPIDVFCAYMSGWQVSAQTIRSIGRLGIFTCAFHWDDKAMFRGECVGGRWSGPAELAAAYDLNFTNAPSSLIKYRVEGGLAMFWPEGANPEHFRPLKRDYEYDVTHIGTKSGYRPILFDYLQRKGINVETFGLGWPNGPVSKTEMVELYNRSRINLGYGGLGYLNKMYNLKGRDFEVLMCGAFYLTSDNPELQLVYEVGKEIVTYRNKEDCLRKIRYYLDHPEERDRIRQLGHERALHDHTWEKRFDKIFKVANILEDS